MLEEQDLTPPCSRTLERWSVADRWQDKARRHDLEVGERLQERATKQTVTEAWEGAKRLQSTAAKLLDAVEERLKGGLDMADITDIRAVVGIVIECVREARVEAGGVSDRTGVVGQSPDAVQSYADDIKRRFAHLGPKVTPENVDVASLTKRAGPVVVTKPVDPDPSGLVLTDSPTDAYPDDGDREPITH